MAAAPAPAARYFIYWTLQAVWIYVTLLPVLVLNGTERNKGAALLSCRLLRPPAAANHPSGNFSMIDRQKKIKKPKGLSLDAAATCMKRP